MTEQSSQPNQSRIECFMDENLRKWGFSESLSCRIPKRLSKTPFSLQDREQRILPITFTKHHTLLSQTALENAATLSSEPI
ncbi:hypothetical protein FGO68_gene8982 [Halteria grandinella]|uniref:Uncharacterized protein n=1 Tax=Halteria grandinella TaxID=5974 RepID=A0A8J8NS52_HALGN|nr:hypothetical protein FGO68_gene8982 [Halteria grandinella]